MNKIIGSGRIVLFNVIASKKIKDKLINSLIESGCLLVNTVYGKGTVKSNSFLEKLGLVPEEQKVLIISILTEDKCSETFDMLKETYNFDKSNTGIAFTTPIDKMVLTRG